MRQFWVSMPGVDRASCKDLQDLEAYLARSAREFWWRQAAPGWFARTQPWLCFYDFDASDDSGVYRIPKMIATAGLEFNSVRFLAALTMGRLIMLSSEIDHAHS